MKPWLLNMLACPVDKYHPLEAYFYSWETMDSKIEKVTPKQRTRLIKQFNDGTISVKALNEIRDKTEQIIGVELYQKFKEAINNDLVEDNIDLIYHYLNVVDVKHGLLRCPKCDRWYPIGSMVDTVPILMPDHFRDHESDSVFLEKWKNKLPVKLMEKNKNG